MKGKFITPDFVFAKDIKRVRKGSGMTQKEFAEFAGVSQPTVERWEAGAGKITGVAAFLVAALDMHPELTTEFTAPDPVFPLRLLYYYDQMLCTIIDVDEVNRKVAIKNYTDNLIFRAFGKNEKPSFSDYEEFLESRCFPRERDKMKIMLKGLDLPFYDPLMIIEKTEGRMAEDDFHLVIERPA